MKLSRMILYCQILFFEVNVAVLTGVKKFDENKENTVAVSRNNLLGKWYISFNYPFWKIKEYRSSAEADKAVQSGEADCFVVKAGQSLKTLANSKMRSIFSYEIRHFLLCSHQGKHNINEYPE